MTGYGLDNLVSISGRSSDISLLHNLQTDSWPTKYFFVHWVLWGKAAVSWSWPLNYICLREAETILRS